MAIINPVKKTSKGGTARRFFVFTDISHSTSLWFSDQRAMDRIMRDHDLEMEAAARACGVELFKHTGDGVCAATIQGRSALSFTRRVLDFGQERHLGIRVAIHRGSAVARGGDYFGASLSVVARLLRVARPGEALVTAAAARLMPGFPYRQKTRLILDDIPGAVEILAMAAPAYAAT